VRSDRIVQLDADRVQADGLDRLTDLYGAFVDQRPAGFFDGAGDVASSHRSEQPACIASPRRQIDRQTFELLAHFLGMIKAADLARVAAALDSSNLFLAAASPADGETAWNQEVAAVTVLDLDYVTGGTELVDGGGQDELHAITFLLLAARASRAWIRLLRRRSQRKRRLALGPLLAPLAEAGAHAPAWLSTAGG
jgi:hypothetical protein